VSAPGLAAIAPVGRSTHLAPPISQRVEVVLVALLVCAFIFELVRRKRLMERYALLWLLAGAIVLVLGLWQGLLTTLAHAVGIYYAPSALFAIAFLFVIVMLVHFSTTVSRLADQNKQLAQRVALLRTMLEEHRREREQAHAQPPAAAAADAQGRPAEELAGGHSP